MTRKPGSRNVTCGALDYSVCSCRVYAFKGGEERMYITVISELATLLEYVEKNKERKELRVNRLQVLGQTTAALKTSGTFSWHSWHGRLP